MNRHSLAAYAENERRRRRFRADPSGRYGYVALQHLSDNANGFVLDAINDLVLVKRNGFPEFLGTMAQALAAGILVNASPPTKMLLNSSGILTSGSNLRCQYSATGTPLGFLSEPQRTNYSTNSEALTGGIGVSTSSNAGTAPDGAQTAELITEDGSTGEHYTGDGNYSVSSGQTYTFSGYVKRGPSGARNLNIRTATAKTANSVLDIVAGTWIGGTGYDSRGLTALSNGWFYFWMTVTASSTANLTSRVQGYNGSTVYTGDGTSNWYYWGRQLELGAFPTSYIKTEGSAVTRAADNLYVDLTKIPFSATVGTAIATAQPGPDTNTNNFGLVQFDDGTANNRLVMTNGTAGEKRARQIVLNGGSVTANIVSAANAAASRYKQAMAWATDDIEMVVNGTTHTIDTSCAVPAGLAYMRIGRTTIGSTEWAAPIESIVYIPERLSQTDMIARTS